MKRTTGKELLEKLKEGTITNEERKLLEAWYDHYVEMAQPLDDVATFVNDMKKLDKAFPFTPITAPAPFYKLMSFRISAVAAIILVVLGIYLIRLQQTPQLTADQLVQNEISPGGQGATLTIGNGQKINLNAIDKGNISLEAGIQITKTQDGQLTYTIQGKEQGPNEVHTLSTAKGETFALILPDKSKVWLNAASSLTYNTTPIEKGQRKVTLTGEAYFEVAKDSKHPFIVASQNQQVEVLGTSFNISAYPEVSSLQTTLVEGSIKLSTHHGNITDTKIMTPNQQATIQNGRIQIDEIVASDVIAWKEGYFLFASESLESVMEKIARWYNVRVVYDNPALKKETMLGTMSRHEQLSKVLDIMERIGIAKFDVNERVIHVRNK